MPRFVTRLTVAFAVAAFSLPAPLRATDVDGPNDCTRASQDFGDAPEGILAYPGVPGMFPTCTAPGPVGVRNGSCPPISTAPGPAGYVRHVNPNNTPPYWLGCTAANPIGIDTEPDGKVNATGGPLSACSDVPIDCLEAAFGMTFGQDECYGSNDAGISLPVTFAACSSSVVTFATNNCATFTRQVYLNILVDMNEDGDWNDSFLCGTQCVYEWAVHNALIALPPGCTSQNSPAFKVGPPVGHGYGWMRISLTDSAVTADYPWNGSASKPSLAFVGGETEDYPVTIHNTNPDPCPPYDDFGDAPEGIRAYPGPVIGLFPTCTAGGPAGLANLACPAISTAPGAAAGYVKHVVGPNDPGMFWLGCATAGGGPGVDTEGDGKVNLVGVGASACAAAVIVDCAETAFGGVMTFGQDECWGDADAGLVNPVVFTACRRETLDIKGYNCRQFDQQAYLNVLVDWNADGDWNDNFQCTPGGPCSYEWGAKNQPVVLLPGCNNLKAIVTAGPTAGDGWMRVTITASPVPDDFPWAGSAGLAGGLFRGGETEDYPVEIRNPTDPCTSPFVDFGDAPEAIAAYSTGLAGRFPTCTFSTPPGTQSIDCGAPLSTPPGPTGYVQHITAATSPVKIWLGCGTPADPSLGRDSEIDGKVNLQAIYGVKSACDSTVLVDCFEPAWISFGQDECYGTPDAALASFLNIPACADTAIVYTAYNCGPQTVDARINVLVDWNGDGDWNDVVKCSSVNLCRPEWTVKNRVVALAPGCNTLQIPIRAGSRIGEAWLRLTLTSTPVADDFPWNGSLSEPNGAYLSGETEDYPVRIVQSLVGVIPTPASDLAFAPLTPNPSRNGTGLNFMLPRDGNVRLVAYDVTGRVVRVLVDRWMSAGDQHLSWDFRDEQGLAVPAGLYLVKLHAGTDEITRRVIRLP